MDCAVYPLPTPRSALCPSARCFVLWGLSCVSFIPSSLLSAPVGVGHQSASQREGGRRGGEWHKGASLAAALPPSVCHSAQGTAPLLAAFSPTHSPSHSRDPVTLVPSGLEPAGSVGYGLWATALSCSHLCIESPFLTAP